ncbi:MAG: hypothetical protein ACOY4H_08255 [Thermodesulfobacteriota bacterium]
MAQELRVETVPTLIFLSRTGEFAGRLQGKVSREELNQRLATILQQEAALSAGRDSAPSPALP